MISLMYSKTSWIVHLHSSWDALCSQHFEYESNYGRVTFGIQKLVVEPEAEAISQGKNRVEDHSVIDDSMVFNTVR